MLVDRSSFAAIVRPAKQPFDPYRSTIAAIFATTGTANISHCYANEFVV